MTTSQTPEAPAKTKRKTTPLPSRKAVLAKARKRSSYLLGVADSVKKVENILIPAVVLSGLLATFPIWNSCINGDNQAFNEALESQELKVAKEDAASARKVISTAVAENNEMFYLYDPESNALDAPVSVVGPTSVVKPFAAQCGDAVDSQYVEHSHASALQINFRTPQSIASKRISSSLKSTSPFLPGVYSFFSGLFLGALTGFLTSLAASKLYSTGNEINYRIGDINYKLKGRQTIDR